MRRLGGGKVGDPAVRVLADEAEIADAVARARSAGCIGIDTEFMSEGRYRPLLCLVQIATPSSDGGPDSVLLIDPLDRPPPAALVELLSDEQVEVVLHAGRQDLSILRQSWGVQVKRVFDTQVAAGFAGLGAQTGYGNLLAEVLSIRLAKTASFTRWDVRPLSTEQLTYARDDVVHLLPMAHLLRERLRAAGRLEWAEEEMAPMLGGDGTRNPHAVWQRLPRIATLSDRARGSAFSLVQWRERIAEREDRPVGSILGDAPLIEIARRRPSAAADLAQLRGVPPMISKRYGQEIIEAVAAGQREPLPLPPVLESTHASPLDAPLVALAEALARDCAQRVGLAYELIASRSDLTRLVAALRRGEPPPAVRALEGWRYEVAGAELVALLRGARSLAVGTEGLLVNVVERDDAEPLPES